MLRKQGLVVRPNTHLLVYFEDEPSPVGYCWSDLIVEETVVVELKAVQAIEPKHQSQLRAYLRTSGFRVGLVVNFGPVKVEVRREDRHGEERKSG